MPRSEEAVASQTISIRSKKSAACLQISKTDLMAILAHMPDGDFVSFVGKVSFAVPKESLAALSEKIPACASMSKVSDLSTVEKGGEETNVLTHTSDEHTLKKGTRLTEKILSSGFEGTFSHVAQRLEKSNESLESGPAMSMVESFAIVREPDPPMLQAQHPQGVPRSEKHYKSLLDLINELQLAEMQADDEKRILWMSNFAFLKLNANPQFSHGMNKWISLRLESGHLLSEVSIFSSTSIEAMKCLNQVVCLTDDYYAFMGMKFEGHDGLRQEGKIICPLSCEVIREMLNRNSRRNYGFGSYGAITSFNSDQCGALSISGRRTMLCFTNCHFGDNGKAFVEAIRPTDDAGPAKLDFIKILPFDAKCLCMLVSERGLYSLTMWWCTLDVETCKAVVSSTELQHLDIRFNKLDDKGAALAECVRTGRGPKTLRVSRRSFEDVIDTMIQFLDGLRGNTHLEGIEIEGLRESSGELRKLASVLQGNSGLTHLELRNFSPDRQSWKELLKSISTHPSLIELSFVGYHIFLENEGECALEEEECTQELINMLDKNESIERIDFDENMFDLQMWEELVLPRLECNLFRNRSMRIREMQVPSMRAAGLGESPR